MGKLRFLSLLMIASFVGVLCSEFLCRSLAFREAAGRLFGNGHLIAITHGKAVYEMDVDDETIFTAPDIVAAENLRHLARSESTDQMKVDRDVSLLRAEFGEEEAFRRGVRSNGFSISSLREKVAARRRSLQWLEKQMSAETQITEQECRSSYEMNPAFFTLPVRYRVSHIFLAAPADTPPEIVESKRQLIDALAARLSRGENLPQLAAEASEDEATKTRGGDLGFISTRRIPPEFFAEVGKLREGEMSKPFRSHLGFHIVQLTDIRPSRRLSFAETRAEITLAMANGRRGLIAGRLTDMLTSATYVGSD